MNGAGTISFIALIMDKYRNDLQYPITLLDNSDRKLSSIGFNVMFGYPLDMLLPCSAPLATVDHFNGGLLALTSLSKTRRKPEKGHQLRLNKKRKRKVCFRGNCNHCPKKSAKF